MILYDLNLTTGVCATVVASEPVGEEGFLELKRWVDTQLEPHIAEGARWLDRRGVKDDHELVEILGEATLGVYRKWGLVQCPRKYFRAALRTKFINYVRWRNVCSSRRPATLSEIVVDAVSTSESHEPSCYRCEFSEELASALRRLSPRHRRVVETVYANGGEVERRRRASSPGAFDYDALAEELGTTREYAKKLWKEARAEIRRSFAELGTEPRASPVCFPCPQRILNSTTNRNHTGRNEVMSLNSRNSVDRGLLDRIALYVYRRTGKEVRG